MKSIFLLLIPLVVSSVYDNFLSNLNAPKLIVPDNFTVSLSNGLISKRPIFEIKASVTLNAIAVDLYSFNTYARLAGVTVFFDKGIIVTDCDGVKEELKVPFLQVLKVKTFTGSIDYLTEFSEDEQYFSYRLSSIFNGRLVNRQVSDFLTKLKDVVGIILKVNKEKVALEKMEVSLAGLTTFDIAIEVSEEKAISRRFERTSCIDCDEKERAAIDEHNKFIQESEEN